MRGYVHIYVDKKTGKISLLKGHKTNVLSCLEDSISAYQEEVEDVDPFKASPYKTWNKFFRYHDYISIRCDSKKEIYSISMNERDEKTHSYGSSLPNCEFTLTETEFDERFDEIMDFLISKVEMIK